MLSEDFDNKIKEAADHHHPAYDEKAWGKMEKLLDKHLPEEKDDRRRIIFFLLLFLLLGGSAWLVVSKPWQKNNRESGIVQSAPIKSATENSTTTTTTANQNSEKSRTNISTESIIDETENNKKKVVSSSTEIKQEIIPFVTTKNNESGTANSILTNKKPATKTSTGIVNEETINNNIVETKQSVKSTPQKINSADPVKETVAENIPEASNNNGQQKPTSSNATPVAVVKQDSMAVAATKIDTDEKQEVAPVKKIITPKSKKHNSFFFTISTGPDVSFSGSDKLGTTKLLAGAGLGFTFKDRFTIKTGLYSGRKIYSASPGEYNPPANFWTYYPYLQKVDADCKVLEIPLLLSYNFGTSAKQNWFVSTGLSSYLMKKEVYNYYYKQTAAGQTVNRKWTINNENKHYFSVLTLSGGYQRSIGKNIFVSAEPYLKLPLSGVGYGKVKLNSGGVLFSIGIKPFNSAKK